MPIDLRLEPNEVPLLTDLYELTMAASFFDYGMNDNASFELTLRRLPENRGFMVAAGLERLIELLAEYRFDEAALAYLDSLKVFKPDFLDFLSQLRFSGSVRAMSEGTIFFADEPIVEIHAPLIEAQLIEPIVMNQVGFASLIATKAARCYTVAGGRRLIDFGMRRAQGADGALVAARSAYLAGFDGSSNVLAGKRYGIPVFGTMAHSYIMAHEREREAFENFARSFPKLSTLLVDTYDTIRGVENTVAVAAKLANEGIRMQAVRLDSGDLLDLSRRSRQILDRAGLKAVAIFASGNLDEYAIADLLKGGAPIDAFGVGTALVVSSDAPSGDFGYKLVEYKGIPRLKTSTKKLSMPGRKQGFRALTPSGDFYADLVGLIDEGPVTVSREFRPSPAEVTALLSTHMENGHPLEPRPTLTESRNRFLESFAKLDARCKSIRRPQTYPVRVTAALNAMLIGEKMRAESRQD
jgi:nicotinate phosphoribosyltransferase